MSLHTKFSAINLSTIFIKKKVSWIIFSVQTKKARFIRYSRVHFHSFFRTIFDLFYKRIFNLFTHSLIYLLIQLAMKTQIS